ncbi:hypothetical protein TIFTF001_026404 [Ficus carica]|uniref:Uncharacterized protein n=1 Tax=Ficus carica TaxID=3494 RepID=A0AA88DLQ6_FICCA|nr:hypothetical protein TIFTF001_026404 [Ficus carica]
MKHCFGRAGRHQLDHEIIHDHVGYQIFHQPNHKKPSPPSLSPFLRSGATHGTSTVMSFLHSGQIAWQSRLVVR